MNRRTFFFVLLLNLVCILSSNAQETEYAQYEKTTTIQNREIHQIVAEYDGKYYYCVDNSPLAGNHYFDAVEISKEDDNLFQLPSSDTNGFNILQYNNGCRFYSHNIGHYCTLDNNNKLVYSASQDSKGLWSFSFQEDGKVQIFRTISHKDYIIVFNTSSKRFVLTTNINYKDYTLPYIFKKQTKHVTNVTISNTLWTTFYSDCGVKIPNGIKVCTIKNIDENELIQYSEYEASENSSFNLKSKTPVLLHSEQSGTYPFYESTDLYPLIFSTTDYLRGTSTDQMIEAKDDYAYYMLTYGTIDNKKVFGFFYGAEDGGPFVNKGGKAYLAVPKSIANQSMGFALVTDNKDITNIGNVSRNPNFKSTVVTTLSGVQVKCDNKDKLPKGIYIINGKKVIVK